MPSTRDLPTIPELVSAFHAGVRGTREKRADGHSGAVYDYIAGPSAILWNQEAQYTRDLFRSRYFDSAEGSDLTDRGRARFQIERILDTAGTGFATLTRASAAAGADTAWAGTRIRVPFFSGRTSSEAYAIAADYPIGATQTVAIVPIRATRTGEGVAVDTTVTHATPQLDDTLSDTTWRATHLVCSDGTTFESAEVYRARVRQSQLDNRVGYAKQIIQACRDVGATNVALFRSDYGGDDLGINACYVGDAGFSADLDLIRRVTVKLESVRVAGADLQVGGMDARRLRPSLIVNLWQDPSQFDLVTLRTILVSTLVRAFSGSSDGYSYRRDALAGAMAAVSESIQSVTFDVPTSDANVLTGPGVFPVTLTRHTVAASNITIDFQGPQ